MTQDYFGTKRVTAWPEDRPTNPEPNQPLEAGYGVKYPDGYISWSPKSAFEAAYRPITAMNFGHAIEAMKAGCTVARSGWNGKDMWIALQRRTGQSLMTHDYIYMRTAQGGLVPWLCSQTDMLAEDWAIVCEMGQRPKLDPPVPYDAPEEESAA